MGWREGDVPSASVRADGCAPTTETRMARRCPGIARCDGASGAPCPQRSCSRCAVRSCRWQRARRGERGPESGGSHAIEVPYYQPLPVRSRSGSRRGECAGALYAGRRPARAERPVRSRGPRAVRGHAVFDGRRHTSQPPVPCTTIGADIWYRLNVPGPGTVIAHVCNSSFDTVLAAYAGDACVGPLLACNDDACNVQSQISFDVAQAGLFTLRLGGFFGETGGGVLNISFVPTGVPNDNCSSCSPITGTGEFPFDNREATTGNDGQDQPLCDIEGSTRITRDVWFCW